MGCDYEKYERSTREAGGIPRARLGRSAKVPMGPGPFNRKKGEVGVGWVKVKANRRVPVLRP